MPTSENNLTPSPHAAWPSARRRGFTLIELISAISVSVIITGVAGLIILNAAKQRGDIAARVELYDSGAAAMDVVTRRLREISQDECPENPSPCLDGNAQITYASATRIEFDETGFQLNGAADSVEMSIDGATNWHALLRNTTGLTFSYFDRTGSALTSLPLSETDRHAVRRIVCEFQLARGGESARLRAGVFLRAFMNEVESDP